MKKDIKNRKMTKNILIAGIAAILQSGLILEKECNAMVTDEAIIDNRTSPNKLYFHIMENEKLPLGHIFDIDEADDSKTFTLDIPSWKPIANMSVEESIELIEDTIKTGSYDCTPYMVAKAEKSIIFLKSINIKTLTSEHKKSAIAALSVIYRKLVK